MIQNSLSLGIRLPLQASNAGLFVSRGQGTHPDRIIPTFELIYVKEGRLSMEEAGQAFEVAEGETLLLWPGRRHRGLKPYAAELSFYWVHFGLRELPQEELALTVPQHASVGRPDHLTLLFRRLIDDQETRGIEPLSASLTVLLMLHEVAGSSHARANSSASAALLAGRADSIIRSRFHEPLTASSLASELNCHPDYLGRVFRQTYERTLTEAIHRRRLQQARVLLLESVDAVETVAHRCGFEEVGYFRRLFKRQEGISPQAFRNIYARLHVNTG
ncbi:AraC family transcriptional regulator (plasmid) [Deinococcus sp. KNUC1210]|uniref:helix-turn-helix transcriptional regulator n=1 Tax=Deinococcus sp. KNUC1210 TaxID=2917691 RepID=UPI001EEFC018|nr:AraC family transcriptional regulator [Deinococcus sp. KNUC1210]ULH17021.1 AraC family transcriptional regulator [Deinococcus sp. KNUC1210]